MKMKLIMEKFNRFLDEARISPPPTRGEAGLDAVLGKIMQDENVPEKAKQLLKKSIEDGDDDHIKSMLVLISNFAPEYESATAMLDFPEKYDYDSGEERRRFGAFSAIRLEQDVKQTLESLVNYEEEDDLDDDYEPSFYYRILGYSYPSDARLDIKGQETPAEVSVGSIPDEEKAVNNPYGDPFKLVEFHHLEHVEMAKQALEANGMRLAPQGLPSATKAKFVDSERTIIDTGKVRGGGRYPDKNGGSFFHIKVKYAK